MRDTVSAGRNGTGWDSTGKGLGTELFLYLSTLVPIVNVDLLVTDHTERILLAWRDDPHSGTGWHVPGRCIRFRETIDEAIRRCAQEELGTDVEHTVDPIAVYEFLRNDVRDKVKDQRERAHLITLTYGCFLQQDFSDAPLNRIPAGNPGCLRWFDTLPGDLLPLQECYRRDWNKLRLKLRRTE